MHKTEPVNFSAEGPDTERAITLTDAVVAIAMTLLILPLVETAGEIDTAHVGPFLGEHWDLLLSFVVSFMVIYVFWAAHGTAYRHAGQVEVPVLRHLNMWWLMIIAFLPFPTAVVGRGLNTTTAPIYIATMFVLSALTSAMVVAAARAVGSPGRVLWAWLTTAMFGLSALISLANATAGMFSLLLLVVVRVVEVRVLARRPASATTPESTTQVSTGLSKARLDDRADAPGQ